MAIALGGALPVLGIALRRALPGLSTPSTVQGPSWVSLGLAGLRLVTIPPLSTKLWMQLMTTWMDA